MAKKYSGGQNMFFVGSVKANTVDGKTDWEKVLKEVGEESGKKQTLEAIKIRYKRLISRDSVRPSSRSSDKTLKRTVKWLEKLVESKVLTELLRKEIRELREEIRVLKKELKSHGPILKWYIDAQKGFKIAKEKKALITE